jgi:hypothetical protein
VLVDRNGGGDRPVRSHPLFDGPLGEQFCGGSTSSVSKPPAGAAIAVYHDDLGPGPVRYQQPLDSVDLDEHLRQTGESQQ